MAKDKRIGELPGISAAAVVGLNRIGVESVHDLLAADFDRVAYIVDDYNEAARLVREARKAVGGEHTASRKGAKHSPEALVPGPLTSVANHGPQHGSSQASAHGGSHGNSHGASQRSGRQAAAAAPPARAVEGTIGEALALAARGLSMGSPEGRAALGRRLNVAGLLLEHGAGETEVAAGLLVELAEGGQVAAEEVVSRLGAPVEQLLEECIALRAAPVLPTGKLPRYYLEMVKGASKEAKRVCATHVLVYGGSGRAGRLMVEALAAGASDELVLRARSAAEEVERAAA